MGVLRSTNLMIAGVFALFTVGVPLSHAHARVPEGLVLYYDFETEEKGQITDLSGQGNNATIKGNPEWVDSLEGMGNALAFNAAGNSLEVPDADSLRPEDAMTVALWMNWDGQKKPCQALDKFQYEVGGWLFKTEGDNLNLWIYDKNAGPNNAGTHFYRVEQPIPDEWTHIAVTFDGKTQRGYVNGALSPRGGEMAWDGPIKHVNAPVKIGAYSGSFTFTGMLDEIAIYNRALTEDEIQDVMENGHTGGVGSVKLNGKLAACWGSVKAQY